MPIDARTENGVLVIKPDDQRLDASNAVAFRESLFAHIDGGVRKMVLDLSGVRFVDSSLERLQVKARGLIPAHAKRSRCFRQAKTCSTASPCPEL